MHFIQSFVIILRISSQMGSSNPDVWRQMHRLINAEKGIANDSSFSLRPVKVGQVATKRTPMVDILIQVHKLRHYAQESAASASPVGSRYLQLILVFQFLNTPWGKYDDRKSKFISRNSTKAGCHIANHNIRFDGG